MNRMMRGSGAGAGAGSGSGSYGVIHVTGMTCSSCSSSVEKAALGVSGVAAASVSLTTEQCRVDIQEQFVGGVESLMREVVDAIDDAGFDAMLTSISTKNGSREKESLLHSSGRISSSSFSNSNSSTAILEAKLSVSGMVCSACSASVESSAKSVEGVIEASANAITGDVQVIKREMKYEMI